MPPKKKKSAGEKGKKKKKEKQEPPLDTELDKPPPENTREYFLVQIRDLEKQLGRYQDKCYGLEVNRKAEVNTVHILKDEMKERIDHYKTALIQKENEITDLLDRVVGVRQERDTEKENYERQLAELRKKHSEDVSRLTHENTVLKNNLDALEEFKIKREEHERENKKLLDDLKRQEEHQRDVIYLLERKNVEDKNRLKNEISVKVNEMAAEFRRVSNKQMAETTKRTIRENVAMQEQLKKLSDKALELVSENDDLRLKDKESRRKISLLEEQEKLMARKVVGSNEVLQMMTDRCKDMEMALKEAEQRIAAFEELNADRQELSDQASDVREKMEELLEKYEMTSNSLTETRETLKEEKDVADKLRVVLSQCADSVSAVLSEPLAGLSEEASQMRATESRNSLLYSLMSILGTAAELQLGPQFHKIKQQIPSGFLTETASRSLTAPQTGLQSRGGGKSPFLLPDMSSVIPHYQPGDLGLVPRDVAPSSIDLPGYLLGTQSPSKPLPSMASKVKAMDGLSRRARYQLIGHIRKSDIDVPSTISSPLKPPQHKSAGSLIQGENTLIQAANVFPSLRNSFNSEY